MQQFDVIVAGASFAGIACAKKMVSLGLSVAVLERKKDVRENIHTTGIVVHEAAELLNLPPHLYKEIKEVRLFSASQRSLEIASDSYIFLATDTPALMQHLVEEATQQGVQFFLGTAFSSAVQEEGSIAVNDGAFRCHFLVGADGAKSKVADVFSLGKNTKFLIGTEFEYKAAGMENPDAFYCFLSQRYARGYIGWVIPGPHVMQIGIAKTYHQKKQSRPDIEGFVASIERHVNLQHAEIVEKRGGLIPIGGVVKPFFSGNVVLVGDAAGIVSPLTAGGIHTALFYGARLGELVHGYLQGNGPHPGLVLAKEYPKFLHKHMYRWIFTMLPDGLFDLLFRLPGFRALAYAVFFLKKRLPGVLVHSRT